MNRRCPRGLRVLVASVFLLLGVCRAASPADAHDGSTPDEQTLADRYSPIVMLRSYPELCADTGEPFVPMTVDPVLGNSEVALRQVGNGDPVIMWGPTAKDLYQHGTGTYLDLPGDALSPGCIYARDSARDTPLSQAAVYGHVVTQADRPGYLAVQYWLYWYYNDWNDKHESDWEFVQVLFRADTVRDALATQPIGVGYAQHVGGETAAWTDPKLERKGTHPVVYSSQGSHASYFSPALYLGRGASEGFGCDNTQGPSTRVTPRVVLLPDAPSGRNDPAAWLSFAGRWGERHNGPNNGPDGPADKPRWTEPVTWQEGLRPSSFVIPGGSDAPPALIGTFCSVVGQGSVVFIRFAANPAQVFTVAVLLVLALAWLLHRTSWDRVSALPIVGRRRGGQIVRAATRLYRRRPWPFLAIGLLAIPVGVVAVVVSAVLLHLPFVGPAAEVSTDQGGDAVNRALVSSSVAATLWPVTVLLMSAAVARLARGSEPSSADWSLRTAGAAVREVRRRSGDLATAYVPVLVLVVLLNLVVVGAPIAAWLTVRYQFLGQVVMLEGLGGAAARRRAAGLVRHRWWHTAMFAFLIWGGIQATGVLLGLILLITVTSLPLWSISLVVLLVQIALTPGAAMALTLLYGDAVAAGQNVAEDELAPAR